MQDPGSHITKLKGEGGSGIRLLGETLHRSNTKFDLGLDFFNKNLSCRVHSSCFHFLHLR